MVSILSHRQHLVYFRFMFVRSVCSRRDRICFVHSHPKSVRDQSHRDSIYATTNHSCVRVSACRLMQIGKNSEVRALAPKQQQQQMNWAKWRVDERNHILIVKLSHTEYIRLLTIYFFFAAAAVCAVVVFATLSSFIYVVLFFSYAVVIHSLWQNMNSSCAATFLLRSLNNFREIVMHILCACVCVCLIDAMWIFTRQL